MELQLLISFCFPIKLFFTILSSRKYIGKNMELDGWMDGYDTGSRDFCHTRASHLWMRGFFIDLYSSKEKTSGWTKNLPRPHFTRLTNAPPIENHSRSFHTKDPALPLLPSSNMVLLHSPKIYTKHLTITANLMQYTLIFPKPSTPSITAPLFSS